MVKKIKHKIKEQKEALTEIEMLQIEKILLLIENTKLILEKKETEKKQLITNIIMNHGFESTAIIKYPDGFIEGRKINIPVVVVKDDKGSD